MAPVSTDIDGVHVRVEDTETAVVVDLELPDNVEASRISLNVHEGTLTITLPHPLPDALDLAGSRRRVRLRGFHPDASGV